MSQISDALVEHLVGITAAQLGYAQSAIDWRAIRDEAHLLIAGGLTPELLRARADRGDVAVLERLVARGTVGETYFFRHPEQFELIAQHQRSRPVRAVVRAWSAGCSTGEEAYSLAACLAASVPETVRVDVLGTDVDRPRLDAARRARYGAWSARGNPDLFPLLESRPPQPIRVRAPVLEAVRFAQHNLLEAPPETAFDVITCRNVLIYLDPEAARAVIRHLAGALVPGGVLLLGIVEATTPPGLVRVEGGPPGAFMRAERRAAAATQTPSPLPAITLGGPEARPAPGVVQLHLEALAQKDHGDVAHSRQLLAELTTRFPDYLPGLLDRALLHARLGEPRAASRVMAELLARASVLAPQASVEGPEVLTASYYVGLASSFLSKERRA